MVGGSLLHGLPLVGLPNIYILYIYIYILIKRWALGLGAVGFDIITHKYFLFYLFLNQCIFLKGCKLSERLHSGFFFYKYNTVFYREHLLFFVIPGIFNKLVHSILREKKL